jgi:OmcA/MtrC family decaheme c-type cytochrome
MVKRLLKCVALGALLVFAFALIGCTGGNTTPAAEADAEEVVLVQQSFSEECSFCHAPGRIADVEVAHSLGTNSPQGEITAVTIDGGTGTVTVSFKLFESANPLVPIAGVSSSSIRFTLAKLVPGTNGDADSWQSYINDEETKEPGDPGTTPDGTTRVQADYERANTTGGVFTDNGDGTYSYQFSFDITNVTDPIAVSYEPASTHRIAMQVSDNVDNAVRDFVPNGGPLPLTRDIVVNSSCNECHLKLGLHGGDRISTKYCVTCHNPGSTDAHSDNTVDLKVMVHKIHYGEELPSVQALEKYIIWGFGNSPNDYSTVVFPQDVRFPGLPNDTCTKCHKTGDAADSDNHLNVPTQEACGSCHDRTSFTDPPAAGFTLHSGGAQMDNSGCAGCHSAADLEDAHELREQIAAQKFEYNIISITDQADNAQLDPGDFVKMTFSVTDPTNGDQEYDILTDPEFTAPFGASRLAILIGWNTDDYTHTGSGSTPASPISINPLAPGVATDNLDGTFTVTSTVAIPNNVSGSGVVAIEGHPAAESIPGSGTYNVRVPVKNVFQYFAVTGSSAVARRSVVDIDNCNQCHGNLSLHGNNRTGEPQVCVICHNPDATDINVRPPGGGIDGKREEAIDFKYMIHSIHAGAAAEHGFREEGIVIYGFGGSENDFSHVRLPAEIDNLKNCTGCHDGNTFEVPLDANALPTTIDTGAKAANPDDDTNITPTASVCSACHDDIESKTHMTENGGKFDFVPFAPAASDGGGGGQSEVDLCGPGPISAQPPGHSESPSCCSCHSVR